MFFGSTGTWYLFWKLRRGNDDVCEKCGKCVREYGIFYIYTVYIYSFSLFIYFSVIQMGYLSSLAPPHSHTSEFYVISVLYGFIFILKLYLMPNFNSSTSIHPLNWNLVFKNPPLRHSILSGAGLDRLTLLLLFSSLKIAHWMSWADERLRRWHGHSR